MASGTIRSILDLEYVEMTGTTNATGLFLIATAAQRIPIFAVPVTQNVTVSGVLLNQYGLYYAQTNKNSTEITLGVFRKKQSS